MSCIEDVDCPHCILILEEQFNWKKGYKIFKLELERNIKIHKEELGGKNKCDHVWDKEYEDWGYGTYKQCSKCWITMREVAILKNNIKSEEKLLGSYKHVK